VGSTFGPAFGKIQKNLWNPEKPLEKSTGGPSLGEILPTPMDIPTCIVHAHIHCI